MIANVCQGLSKHHVYFLLEAVSNIDLLPIKLSTRPKTLEKRPEKRLFNWTGRGQHIRADYKLFRSSKN